MTNRSVYSAFQNFLQLVKDNGGSCIHGDLKKDVATIDFTLDCNCRFHVNISNDVSSNVWIISTREYENKIHITSVFNGFYKDVLKMETCFFNVETKVKHFWCLITKQYPIWKLQKTWNNYVRQYKITHPKKMFVSIGLDKKLGIMKWMKVSISGFYGSWLTNEQKYPPITELANVYEIAVKLGQDDYDFTFL